MAVLSSLFMALFGRMFSRYWAALAAILSLVGYSLLVGAGASVVRAAIMCALAISAAQIGRSAGAFNALMLSAGVMCAFDPNLPWDVSFQLTFMATLGLMLYAGPLQGWFAGFAAHRLPAWAADRLVGPVGEYLLCTLAAQLTTLPVIVWHFGRLSLSSLIANPLALPPQAPLMVLGGLSIFGGLIWEPFGRFFALFTWPLTAYTNRLVEALAQIPGGQITLGPDGAVAVAILCALVMLVAVLRERMAAVWALARPSLLLLALGGLTIFVWRAALANPDGRLHLTVLDVEGGPAVLLRAPQGESVLIGGAQKASELETALGKRLAHLDGLALASTRGLEGLNAALEVFPARKVFTCGALPTIGTGGKLSDALAKAGTPVERFDPARGLRVGAAARVEVVAQTADGCLLRVTMGRLGVLIPGGLELSGLPPGTIQAGEIVMGAASPDAWKAAGARVLAPPPGGWVEVQSDGEKMWIEEGK